jgi:heme exporter protein D
MDAIAKFFEMGGYAGFVWPAFGIALAVLAGFVIISLRTLKSREATLRALEAAAPESPRARRRARAQKAAEDAAASEQAGA